MQPSSLQFAIVLLEDSGHGPSHEGRARVTIGAFEEVISLSPLRPEASVADLPDLWRHALLAFVDGADFAILRVAPAEIWVLYRVGELVAVQNQLLTPEWEGEIDASGVPIRPPQRRQMSGGARVSEWHTSITAIRDFLEYSGRAA